MYRFNKLFMKIRLIFILLIFSTNPPNSYSQSRFPSAVKKYAQISGMVFNEKGKPVASGRIFISDMANSNCYIGGQPDLFTLQKNYKTFSLISSGKFSTVIDPGIPHEIFFTSPGK